MSLACPCMPPSGWWIMMREWGRAKRLPLAPATRRMEAMEAATPVQMVETSLPIYCIVS